MAVSTRSSRLALSSASSPSSSPRTSRAWRSSLAALALLATPLAPLACGASPAAPPHVASVTSASASATAISPDTEAAPPAPALAVAPRGDLASFDAYVEAALAAWKSPGLAVVIVQDGKVVHMKGYGLRDVDKKLPVTPKTLFAIGSITKSFTVASLGTLVDEGKLDWDTPVREYLPGFKMYSDDATAHLTLRDMLSHRSGLPRHDAVWYGSPLSRKEIIDRLRFLEPNKQLREAYQYNNLMFMTAGYLGGQVAGSASWEDFVTKRMLRPLGMSGVRLSVDDAQKAPDFSQPYRYRVANDDVIKIPFRQQGAIAPAGSINAGVEDMARYLVMHMTLGKLRDARVLSEASAREMQTPQIIAGRQGKWAEIGAPSYALGLGAGMYRGKRWVGHGGGIDGFTAQLKFLPDDKIGVVVLGNLDGSDLPNAIAWEAIDRMLGVPSVDWSKRLLDDRTGLRAAEQDAKKKGFSTKKPGTKPTHDLADYVAEYEHPAYGLAKVEMRDGALTLTHNQMAHPLAHYHYDVFEVPENPLDAFEKLKVSFAMNVDGDVERVVVVLEPSVRPIEFSRIADKKMRDKTFLAAFTGTYVVGGISGVIALKGDHTLTWQQSGGGAEELVPLRGTTFALKSEPSVRFEFKRGANGVVTEAAIYTPDSNYVATKKN